MKTPEFLNEHLDQNTEMIEIGDYILGNTRRILEQREDAKTKEKSIILISGLSGAGKDTITNGLLELDERFGRIKTCTTRERRKEETEANDKYVRLTVDQFLALKDKSDVIEWVEYSGSYYCSLKSLFAQALESVEFPIFIVDPRGAKFYIDLWRKNGEFFKNASLKYFYVLPPSYEALYERLLTRSEDKLLAEKRLALAIEDISFINEAQYLVVNESGKIGEVIKGVASLV